MIDTRMANGWSRLESWPFDAYNEAGRFPEAVERYREREGHDPARVPADKLYRPKHDEEVDEKQEYPYACDRVKAERRFGLAKRKCG